MKSQNIFVNVHCPIHASEIIQRVDMNPFASQQLYCFDCILLSQKSSNLTPQNLKTIPDLVEIAATFYSQNKKTVVESREQIPQEYLDLLGSQAEKLEQLSQQIESEKKRMSNIFDSILEDVTRVVSERKNKCLDELDQQLFNLKCWYFSFEKQVKRRYPAEGDISILYSTKEDLVNKLNKINNATQLMAFVRDLKEDLNEDKLVGAGRDQGLYLHDLSQELKSLDSIRPQYNEGDLKMKEEIRSFLGNLFSRFPDLESPVGDVFKGPRLDSILLQGQGQGEYLWLLREWIPKNLKFRLKLLYRGSRDGLNGPAFHHRCDGVKNTISVIKCTFKGASTSSLIGGFLDEAWVSDANYIVSENSFIFSLTTKKRCLNSNPIYAGIGSLEYGPSFGGGYDIGILYHQEISQCSVKPSTYSDASQIIDSPSYSGSGGAIDFTLEDIEVFCL